MTTQMTAEQLMALTQTINSNTSLSSSTQQRERFTTKLRANIAWCKPNPENPKGYTLITLPFGIQLELSPEQRKQQLPESLQFLDLLAEKCRAIPAGESRELGATVGGICISLRHQGEQQQANNELLANAINGLNFS